MPTLATSALAIAAAAAAAAAAGLVSVQVPIPHVSDLQRLLLSPLEFKGFYRCVARYGYMDKVEQVGESHSRCSILQHLKGHARKGLASQAAGSPMHATQQ
jgi:hypothetical protein